MIGERARVVADLTGGVILAEVEIAASPERVYEAILARDAALAEGVDTLPGAAPSNDVRIGGTYRANYVGPDGQLRAVEGTYLEVDPRRTLVRTWLPSWEPHPTVVTFRLDAIEGGTRLLVRHDGFVSPSSCDLHANGWRQAMQELRTLRIASSRVPPAPPRVFFFVRLLPPRPTFMNDMSPQEKRAMGEHVLYWRRLLAQGTAHAFGPVGGPGGGFGIAVVEVEGEEELARLEAEDPAIASGFGLRYEVSPMPTAVVRR